MKIIALKDNKDRGYTVYHEDFPSVITQVEKLEDANQVLADIFEDIMLHTKIEEHEHKNMSLNQLFRGKKVRKQLGYGKFITLTISDIKENFHKYSNNKVVFKNYTVTFTNGETEIFDSLEDINFYTPLVQKIINKLIRITIHRVPSYKRI